MTEIPLFRLGSNAVELVLAGLPCTLDPCVEAALLFSELSAAFAEDVAVGVVAELVTFEVLPELLVPCVAEAVLETLGS